MIPSHILDVRRYGMVISIGNMLVCINPVGTFIQGHKLTPEITSSPVVPCASTVRVEGTTNELALLIEGVGEATNDRLARSGCKSSGIEIVGMGSGSIVLDSLPSGSEHTEA